MKKLLDVKTLVTLSLTAVVVYLTAVGEFDIKEIYIVVISFYFGTQHEKGSVKHENQNTSIDETERNRKE